MNQSANKVVNPVIPLAVFVGTHVLGAVLYDPLNKVSSALSLTLLVILFLFNFFYLWTTYPLAARLYALAIIDVIAIQMVLIFWRGVSPVLASAIGLFTIAVNVVFLYRPLYPWRWVAPALGGMVLLVLYPIGYSFIVAFTNYGDGNNLTKEQVLSQLTNTFYTPEGGQTFQLYVYGRDAAERTIADFRFFLVDTSKNEYIGTSGAEKLDPVAESPLKVDTRDDRNIPVSLGGGEFKFLAPQGVEQTLNKLGLDLRQPPYRLQITKMQLIGRRFDVAQQSPKYVYDAAKDTVTDTQTNKVYIPVRGRFAPEDGEGPSLPNGFPAFIGFDNILRVVRDDNVRDPFFRVFIWTFVFAIGSVLTTFAVGLMFALILNGKDLPLRPLWRSILIIPYAIPFWLSVTVWRGVMNPEYGPFNLALEKLIGVSPNWFADPTLAKILILFVNLYLGFPYMMLITLGALQSIPADMYEAALIDGANNREQFQFITLPLLLVAVGPLLVASFAFNFNNFTIIELATTGGPPISAGTVAGHTDILISYTFRLAQGGARGADYGFASAIAIFIFIIVGTITFFNFRFNRTFEKVAEGI